MTEFYTSDVIRTIREQELEMERSYAMLEAYDPYADFDDDFEEDTQDDYDFEGNEDRGMEGYLFGWDS